MLKIAEKPGVSGGKTPEILTTLLTQIERSIRGKRQVIERALVCLLARGHVLFEDVPGVGKTTLSLTLARSLGLSFRRVQCTADLLPSDVVGVVVYDQKQGVFEFKAGPIFANVLLVDEINRATPKTQSAMLEAMGEGTVSVDKQSHRLPDPFWVVATQNPLDSHGTHPLPENQLDRFLMRLSVGYPDAESEREIVMSGGAPLRADKVPQVVTSEALHAAMSTVAEVTVDASVADYAVNLCRATREAPEFVLGASTRAAVALMGAARALAFVRGRNFAIPDDISELWLPVMNHRVNLRHSAQVSEREAVEIALRDVLSRVRVPT
jgi:MoxR-like ATPase